MRLPTGDQGKRPAHRPHYYLRRSGGDHPPARSPPRPPCPAAGPACKNSGLMALRETPPAKLVAPGARGLTPRPRLYRALDRASRAAWVWGPPGAGKTSLLAAYLSARGLPFGWYQIDRGDSDLASFVHYLGTLGRTRPFEPSPAISTGSAELLAAVALRKVERLLRSAPARFVLILEDLHELPAGTPLVDLMPQIVGALPPGRRLLMTSRSAPAAALARLHAYGALRVVGPDDLKLTFGEARAVASRTTRGTRPGGLAEVIRRADGWAAGLVLLLHARSERMERSDGGARGHAALFDYFATEVLDALSPERRDALLALGMLPAMDALTATELTGQPWAGRLLDEFAASRRFVERRAEGQTHYRLHPLFREFLLARGRMATTPEGIGRARRAAVEGLIARGKLEDAVALLIQASAWDDLGGIIVRHAPALVRAGRERTLGAWIDAFPPARIADDPWLAYWRAVSSLPGGLPTVRAGLVEALHGFEATRDARGQALALAQILDGYFLEWSRYRDIDPWIERTERHICSRLEVPREIEPALLISAFRAMFYRRPDHPRVPWLLERLHGLREQEPGPLTIGAGLALAFHYAWIGQPARAMTMVRAAQDQISAANAPVIVRQTADYMEALAALKLGDGPGCLGAAGRGLARAADTGVHALDFRLHSMRVYGAMTAREGALAARHLEWMREGLPSVPLIDRGYYHVLAGWHAAVHGDLPGAGRHAASARALAEDAGLPSLSALTAFLSAQLACERGDLDGATAHLRRMREIGTAMRSESLRFMADLCEVDLRLARGDEPAADALLRETLARGRVGGLGYYAGWRPTVMARLCARALSLEIEIPYVQALVRAQALVPEDPPFEVRHWPWPVEIRVLGPLAVCVDGRELRWTGRAQQRPLDLLRAVAVLGGRHVPLGQVTDALWPEADGAAARAAFDTTVLRLRRLLGRAEALVVEDSRVGLDERLCTLDLWVLERVLGAAERAVRTAGRLEEVASRLERAIALYQGPLLADSAAPWTLVPRERLRARLVRAVEVLGRGLEARDRRHEALDWYRRGLEIDGLAETLSRYEARCCHALGLTSEAAALARRSRAHLVAVSG